MRTIFSILVIGLLFDAALAQVPNSCPSGQHLACVPDVAPPPPPPPPSPSGVLTSRSDCPASEVLSYPDDGPAKLPQACVHIPSTPTGGVVQVASGASALQAALVPANCGKVLMLALGGIYGTGGTIFTGPNCTAGNWIQIRSAVPDAQLPPPGTRITPSYFGVASLPGRRAYAGAAPTGQAPKLVFLNNTSFILGSYTILGPGLEITMPAGTVASSTLTYQMVVANKSHIVIDRNWIHGTPLDEGQRGVSVSGGDHVAVIDSYLNDFHCRAPGKCSDAQAILGGLGASGAGFLIDNNYLEASAENVLFGGGGATKTASDIIIRRNSFYKPLTWLKGSPGFVGVTFYSKNLFELKNAQRVLFEGNTCENAWGGFSQVGFGILLTPKNQNGQAPGAQVSDVTIRYSECRNTGAGIQLSATKAVGTTGNLSSLGIWNVSVHDIIWKSIDRIKYTGSSGTGWQLTRQDSNAKADTISIRNVTFTGPGQTGGQSNAFIFGSLKAGALSITNSVFNAGTWQTSFTGAGPTDCAYQTVGFGAKALANCWAPVTWTGNVVVSGKNWPSGTLTPATSPFVNAAAGDYHALPPYVGSGADVDAVATAISGVD